MLRGSGRGRRGWLDEGVCVVREKCAVRKLLLRCSLAYHRMVAICGRCGASQPFPSII